MTRPKVPASDEAVYDAWKRATGPDKTRLEAELYAVLRRYARSIMYQMVGQTDSDLTGQIVEHALVNHHKFRGSSKFTTWFYRLAHRKILDWLRYHRRKRECSLENNPEVDQVPVPRSGALAPEDLQILVAQLMERLSPEDQRLFQMKLDGYAEAEIATALGLHQAPEGHRQRSRAVRKRWARLQKLIREQHADVKL